MMISINLLPEYQKKALRKKRRFKLMLYQEMALLLVGIFLVVVLGSIYVIQDVQFDGIEAVNVSEQRQKTYQELKKYEDVFRAENANALLVIRTQKNHFRWSAVFEELNRLMPKAVRLTTFANNGNSVSLAGKARTREFFLEFQNQLGASPCFEKVNAPLSNLVSREDVEFQIDFLVKSECLKE